ncbi:lecithin retinol acyltransferase family protein [Thalassotalea ponticola]|uniref:lecithin retinol acyltransferase family protein n=1 Tax=Thalassotalea ponticola TaxID=1523392 RepID=UPI0025B4FB19|nr:lecithin retinol acyltransferase family protein [Thalassotalea ponticola]MDN3652209.1 lecithin retinol acyltransferase family protein [Thalassotalea ponticola]
MPLPLFVLTAAALGAVVIKELEGKRDEQDKLRSIEDGIDTRQHLNKHDSGIARYPNERFANETLAQMKPGALVCCGLGRVLEHTGIWVDDNTIVELHGSGLIKAVSPMRFLHERSGTDIFVACDRHGQALADEITAQRAAKSVYQMWQYNLIKNNCHRFAWYCISGLKADVTTFHQLNKYLSKRFDRKIYWDKWQQRRPELAVSERHARI